MENDTMEFLQKMLIHLRPQLMGKNMEWAALEQREQQLQEAFREAHQGEEALLDEVMELADVWGGIAENMANAHFMLGVQMGIDMGRLNYLRQE